MVDKNRRSFAYSRQAGDDPLISHVASINHVIREVRIQRKICNTSNLTKLWGLPETFYIPIGHHHAPQNLSVKSQDCSERTKMLHLSSLYIDVFNTSDINFQMGTIDHFCKEYGLAGIFDPADLAKEIHHQAQEVFLIFDVQFKDDRDYADLLNTAKAEMSKLSAEMIAELLEKNREIEFLREQTTIDSMTSIRNYKGFSECLSRELNRAKRYKKPLSVIFADIDHFKGIALTGSTFMLVGYTVDKGALRRIAVTNSSELLPEIRWLDLNNPTEQERQWVRAAYGQELQFLEELSEIEASARYYRDESGLHLNLYFLNAANGTARNVNVAFTVHDGRLYTLHADDVPELRAYYQHASAHPELDDDPLSILLGIVELRVGLLADTYERLLAELETLGRDSRRDRRPSYRRERRSGSG